MVTCCIPLLSQETSLSSMHTTPSYITLKVFTMGNICSTTTPRPLIYPSHNASYTHNRIDRVKPLTVNSARLHDAL